MLVFIFGALFVALLVVLVRAHRALREEQCRAMEAGRVTAALVAVHGGAEALGRALGERHGSESQDGSGADSGSGSGGFDWSSLGGDW